MSDKPNRVLRQRTQQEKGDRTSPQLKSGQALTWGTQQAEGVSARCGKDLELRSVVRCKRVVRQLECDYHQPIFAPIDS